MPYVTKDQVEAYVGRQLNLSDDEYAHVIGQAGRDIDRYIGGRFAVLDDGTRFGDLTVDPYPNRWGLTTVEQRRLRDATAAQVEYRVQMGPDFFIEDQRESVQGPDGITETGKVGRVGPKAREELMGTRLVRMTGRIV